MNSKKDFSLNYLCNFSDRIDISLLDNYEKQLWECNWLEILKSKSTIDFLQNGLHLNDNKDYEIQKEYDSSLLQRGLAFLFAFIQENFTGPKLNDEYKTYSNEMILNDFKITEKLSVDTEEINCNVQHSEFLYLSQIILKDLLKRSPDSLVINWWMLRLICIHQQVLDDLTGSAYEQYKNLSKKLLDLSNNLLTNEMELDLILKIEIVQGFLLFHRVYKSNEFMDSICSKFNIKMEIEGLLGLRTKFQQKPLPQLCLKVLVEQNDLFPEAFLTNNKMELPKLLKLDDEVRLERIKFINEADNDIITLPSVLQALVLTKLKYLLLAQPKDLLASEELQPYITTLLYQEKGPWTVRLATLLLNVAEESNHRRTVERCLKQSEEVSNLIMSNEKYSVYERLSYVFISTLPAQWNVETQLGDLMISLGFIKTALDLYIRIQSWENVIYCYNRLELKHKAAEIIQQELDKKPTTKLYCLLGDATDNPEYYETAWKFSKETSGRAQRHWGNYYFSKKQYEAALPYLQKTVEINSLQEIQWLRLGYAAMELEKWQIAVNAYIRYTHLEPSGFESWNNLAKALIQLGDKKRAHKILNESLKCNYNNWKVWENFMLVSIDTGNFEDALNAYNRLIELKEKENFLDLEVLEIVCKAIEKNLTDANGRTTLRLTKKALKLLGHQCMKYPHEWKLWEYSALISETPMAKGQKYQKCLRAYQAKEPKWMEVKVKSIKCLDICIQLCTVSLETISNHEQDEQSSVNSQLSSARLAGQACLRVTEKTNFEKCDETDKQLIQLKNLYDNLSNQLKQRV